MSKNIEAKKVVVSEIEEKIEKAQSIVVVEYKALTVEQGTALRAKCRAANVDYCVLKNTLYPVKTDIVSVTVLCYGENGGIKSDFLATDIFIGGTENIEKHLSSADYKIVVADENKKLYVSEVLVREKRKPMIRPKCAWLRPLLHSLVLEA